MGKINYGRVILGGLVAGIVLNVLAWLVDGYMLAKLWSDGMRILLHPAAFSTRTLVLFNLIGFAAGIALVWIYAAIRTRFGAGVKTAVYAGLACWFIGTLLPNASFMYAAKLFGGRLTLYTTLGGIVELLAAAIVGASLYKEAATAPVAPAVAAETREAMRA
jgi:hypothetical protein